MIAKKDEMRDDKHHVKVSSNQEQQNIGSWTVLTQEDLFDRKIEQTLDLVWIV